MKNAVLTDFIVPALVTLGVVPPLFYHMADIAAGHEDNFNTFGAFARGLAGYTELATTWKPRILSNLLAWRLGILSEWIRDHVEISHIHRTQVLTISLWTATWFVLLAILYVLWKRRTAVFYILGTFAALSFGYPSRLADTRVYPWDMPALFVYLVFLVLFLKNRYGWMLVMLPVAVAFKETAGVLCLTFLLAPELTAAHRWKMFAAAGALCLMVKLGIDIATRSSAPIMTMDTGISGGLSAMYLLQNVTALTRVGPLLVNAGTLLAFFVLPPTDDKLRILRLLAIAFALGNFAFGRIVEYRIWFEVIPFSLYAIERAMSGEGATGPIVAQTGAISPGP